MAGNDDAPHDGAPRPEGALRRAAGVACRDAGLHRGEARLDPRAAPAMGQGAEHRPDRAAKGTPALRGAEAGRRYDHARSARPDAAVLVDAARGIAGGETGRPGTLSGAHPGAARDLRSSLPPLAVTSTTQCDISTGTVMLRSTGLASVDQTRAWQRVGSAVWLRWQKRCPAEQIEL